MSAIDSDESGCPLVSGLEVAPNSTNQWIGCQSQTKGDSNPTDEVFALPSTLNTRPPGCDVLRIALVIERFVPDGGGVEGVAWRVASELDRLGLDVTVFTRVADPDRVKDTRRSLNVHRIPVPTGWQPLRIAAFSRAAARAAQAGSFDVVHSFSRTRHQDLYRAGGGSHQEYMRHQYSTPARILRAASPRHHILRRIEGAVFDDPSQRIQCASRFVADALIEKHGVSPERILLLPNAVDAKRFGTEDTRSAGRRLRAEIDDKAERIWLFPASGWQRKGLTELFESLTGLRDPGLRLWIAGRDDPRPWQRIAKQLGISDRVRFLGQRDDLDVIYGAVDGMVLPTRYDAFANVTLEAAASGLPVITTKTNGAAEWLDEAVVRLEDARDPVALAEAMQALSNVEQRRELGDRAQTIARRMDWPGHAAALVSEYQRILGART